MLFLNHLRLPYSIPKSFALLLAFHTIRHSFAMALKEQNVPIEMISELFGHKSIKTTQIYLRSFSLEKMTEVNSTCFGCVYNYVSKVG